MAPSKSKKKTPKHNTSTTPSKATGHTTPPPPPNWPPLTPPIPHQSPTLTTLLPTQILLIPHLFSTPLCKTYTTFLSTLPLTTTPTNPQRGQAIRVNDRFQTHDPTFALALWTQTNLQALVTHHGEDPSTTWGGQVLGLNPNIRVYRYRPGQFFDRHYDESNKLTVGDPPVPAKTTWTLLVYLSRCEGGETVFYPEAMRKGPRPEPVVVRVEAGLALLHRHGEECLLHEGREVTGGEKWVLRSDLVVRR